MHVWFYFTTFALSEGSNVSVKVGNVMVIKDGKLVVPHGAQHKISRDLNVSAKTVSLALSNSPIVGKRLKMRIRLHAMEKYHGYVIRLGREEEQHV